MLIRPLEGFFQTTGNLLDRYPIASFRIPLAFLRLFVPGAAFTGAWRANVYKCGDLLPVPHFISWNPITTESPDFHRPEFFGQMRFA